MMLWSLHTERAGQPWNYFRCITTYLITILQRHGHIASILRHLRCQWPWIPLRGHLRSLILAPIENSYMTSYWTSIVTLVLSCRVSEILELLYAESRFFNTPPLFRPKFQGLLRGVDDTSIMLRSAESEHPRLTNREIIFEYFQPMWSWYLNVTDRRLAVAIPHSA